MEEGIHCFAMEVSEPVDDAYWLGIMYLDGSTRAGPKTSKSSILWSGGSPSSDRPGTIRLHAEKFRKQAMYEDGDVVACAVDMDQGDVDFYRNGERCRCVYGWVGGCGWVCGWVWVGGWVGGRRGV